jgi:hypothetical protein
MVVRQSRSYVEINNESRTYVKVRRLLRNPAGQTEARQGKFGKSRHE